MKKLLLLLLIPLTLLVFACGEAKPTPTLYSPITLTPAATTMDPTELTMVVAAQHDEFGSYLTDSEGMTLYVYTTDDKNLSKCISTCPLLWPPLRTVAGPSAGKGVTADLLGTITRIDGSMQVTYNGRPLYYFSNDDKPGDTGGHNNVNKWFVVTPDGEPYGIP